MKEQGWGILLPKEAEDMARTLGETLGVSVGVADNLTEGLEILRGVAGDLPRRVIVGWANGEMADEDLVPEEEGLPDFFQVPLKTNALAPHLSRGVATGKTARLLRSEMRGVRAAPRVSSIRLSAGKRVVIFAEAETGLTLARMLSPQAIPLVFSAQALGETGEAEEEVPDVSMAPGILVAIQGRLGAFEVEVAPLGGGEGKKFPADQVVVLTDAPQPEVHGHTGIHYHPKNSLNEEQLAACAEAVQALIGTFDKEETVTYNPETCAGGSAGVESCGLCQTYCPYNAVTRDPGNKVRMRVDHLSCEGCGACGAVCPTGAIAMKNPSLTEISARLSGLLEPLAESLSAAMTGAEATAPPVVVFHCGEQGRYALEMAAEKNQPYSGALLPLEMPCLRAVSEHHILEAFQRGAAGVALLGCDTCPNGERSQILTKVEMVQTILKTLGMGAERLRLFTTTSENALETMQGLALFVEGVKPTSWGAVSGPPTRQAPRERMGQVLTGWMDQLGIEPGGIDVGTDQPYALLEIDEATCTLCRSCGNNCPARAISFQDDGAKLVFRHLSCVGCDLCVKVCPENAISLKRMLFLEKEALKPLVLVEDQLVLCDNCQKPFGNQKAMMAIEARVLGLPALSETFGGDRSRFLRMCPDCRGVAAVEEMGKGWSP